IGQLRIGFVGPAMDHVLPEALRSFRRSQPRVRLTLWHRGSIEQLRALRADEIDVGVIRKYGQDFAGLEFESMWEEPYVLALPDRHRLAGCEPVHLGRLGTEALV